MTQPASPRSQASGLVASPSDVRFGSDGLVPVIAQEATTGAVLMLAWMDAEALRRTVQSRRATYWSRSRQEYWVKGETSGHTQDVVSIDLDCDGDAVLLRVHQTGPACHTGLDTCFSERPLIDPVRTAGA